MKKLFVVLLLLMPTFAFSGFSDQYEKLYNPLPTNELFCPTIYCDLVQMFLIITRNILQLIPIAAVLAIIVGGFQMVMSSGNEERLLKAKRTIFWAVIGLIISILAVSIVAIVKNFIGANV